MGNDEKLQAIFNEILHENRLGAGLTKSAYRENILYAELYKIVNNFCSNFADRIYIESNRKFYFNFVDNPSLNAYAFSVGDDDFVAITTGVIDRLFFNFHAMLADDEVFSEMPPAALNDAGFLPHGERAMFAFILLQSALGFLIGHETGHILNGHVRLGGNSEAMYIEYPAATSPGCKFIESQALEMDADCSGVHLALSIATFARERLTRESFTDGIEKLVLTYAFGNPRAAIRTTLFAIYTMFLVLDTEYPIHRADWLKNEHPPAQIRAHWTILTTLEEMKNRPELGFPQGNYSPWIGEMPIYVECAYQRAVRKAPIDDRFKRNFLLNWEAGREHLRLVEVAWGALRPRLEPLKLGRGKLPA